jgi:hypothetical protein
MRDGQMSPTGFQKLYGLDKNKKTITDYTFYE